VATAAINTTTTRGTKPIRRHFLSKPSSAATSGLAHSNAKHTATAVSPRSARILTAALSISSRSNEVDCHFTGAGKKRKNKNYKSECSHTQYYIKN
jgi:hypothetical protein